MAKVVKKSKPAKKKVEKPTNGATWHTIKQSGGLRSTSSASRQRRWRKHLRIAGIGLAVIVAAGGMTYGLYFSGQQWKQLTPSADVGTIERIEFSSDGVLDGKWFQSRFPIELGVRTMGYDLQKLKGQLEAEGQVKSASVSVSLPDTLIVEIEEHEPILRARVRTPGNRVIDVLVSAEGAVYQGYNYLAESIASLPGLAGVRFRWVGDAIEPISAMDRLAPLIETARENFPNLYRDWYWISVAGLDTDPESKHSIIEIRSRTSDRIVFAPHQFEGQLRKLNEVVAVNQSQRLGGFTKIDLSYPGQAIVQIRKS
jgi:cell division septal protein FtsQ